MKTLTIKERTVLERTGFKKFAFKEITQVTIVYGDKEYKNHSVNEQTAKIAFKSIFATRSEKELNKYLSKLGRKQHELFIKETVANLIK